MAIWISKIFSRYNEIIISKMVTEKHNAWIICYLLDYRLEWQHRSLVSHSQMLESFMSTWSSHPKSHWPPRSISYPFNDLSFCAIQDKGGGGWIDRGRREDREWVEWGREGRGESGRGRKGEGGGELIGKWHVICCMTCQHDVSQTSDICYKVNLDLYMLH